MADDVLASFMVALGFKVDQGSASAAKRSVADYEKAVRDAEKRIEDARWQGAKTEEEVAKLTRELNLKLAREGLDRAKEAEKTELEAAKKRKERSAAFVTGMEKMAIAATAAATAISYAVAKIAGSFDNLYFQAQRSGTSVQSLKAIGYAFSQTGSSAQQAGAAVDSFTTKLRNNPGLRQFVKELGVSDSLQGVDKFIATLDALKKQPYEVGVQYAEMLGISEENFNLFSRQGEALKRYRAEYDETTKRIGLNSEDAATAASSFQRTLTRLQATISALGDNLLISLAPALESIAKRFQDWISANPEKIEHIMRGIADAVVWLAEKLGAMVTWFAGAEGDAFMKRWDAFADRVKGIATAFEAIFGVLKKIAGFTHLSTILGAYDKTIGGILAGPAAFERAHGGGSAPADDDRSLYQRLAPKFLGGKDAPGVGSDGGRAIKPTSKNIDPTVEAYIRKAAAARGINPDTAVGVADGEGLGGSTPDKLTPGDFKNGKPTSFGPFQLHRGGPGSVGSEYEKATGHSADDPAHWQEQIDFALNWAKKNGWNAWYGRSKHGIGEREGLNYDPNTPTGSSKQVGGNVAPVDGVGGLEQNQGGATRRQPITEALRNQIVAAAKAAGVNAEVYSGGQDESGPNRTGSHRHDHGRSADLKLYTIGQDGKRHYLSMENEAERKIMEGFIRESVKAGANGVGAALDYMGANGIHVGGGSAAAWGAGGSTANAPDWVRRAHEQGMEERNKRGAAMPGLIGVDPQSAIKPSAPMGANGVTNNSTSRAVSQTITNNVNIDGSSNPRDHGRIMESSLSRIHGLALANAQSAVA